MKGLESESSFNRKFSGFKSLFVLESNEKEILVLIYKKEYTREDKAA